MTAKRFYFLNIARKICLFAVIGGMLLALSCTHIPTTDGDTLSPDQTNAPTTNQFDDYETGRFILAQDRAIAWNDFLFYADATSIHIPTQTSFNLCGDPACTGNRGVPGHDNCPLLLLYAKKHFVISYKESINGKIVIYFDAVSLKRQEWANHSSEATLFYRYDTETMTLTAYDFYFKPTGIQWTFDAVNCIIYYTTYEVDESGKTLIALYAFDTQKESNTFLSYVPGQTTVQGCYDGKLLINITNSGYYTLDTTDETPVLEPYEGQYGSYYDGYFYYFGGDAEPQTAVPPETIEGYTWHQGAKLLVTTTKRDLYRISLESGSEPELVAEDVYPSFGLHFDRGYLLYTKPDPKYLYAMLYDSEKYTYYDINDSSAPEGLSLNPRFQLNDGTFYLLNLETLESTALDLTGYDVATPILFAPQSGYFVAIMENLTLEGTLDRYNNYPFGSAVPDCYYYLPYADNFSQGAQDVVLLSMPR